MLKKIVMQAVNLYNEFASVLKILMIREIYEKQVADGQANLVTYYSLQV